MTSAAESIGVCRLDRKHFLRSARSANPERIVENGRKDSGTSGQRMRAKRLLASSQSQLECRDR